MPAVSIGLPVRNGAQFITETLDSLLAQEFTDFEVVIADNQSDDTTEDICRHYASIDDRINYIRHRANLGAAANYNYVFKHARGTYFKWTGHDDTYEPQFLQRCVEELQASREDVVLVHAGTRFIDDQGAELGIDDESLESLAPRASQRLRYVLRSVYGANAIFGVMRRETLSRTRLIDPYYAADYMLLAELAMLGKIRFVPEVLMSRRVHRGMSHLVNHNVRDVLAWYDPRKDPNWLSTRPGKRLLYEYYRSAIRIPRGLQRLLCVANILPVYAQRRFRRTKYRPVKMSSYLDSQEGQVG